MGIAISAVDIVVEAVSDIVFSGSNVELKVFIVVEAAFNVPIIEFLKSVIFFNGPAGIHIPILPACLSISSMPPCFADSLSIVIIFIIRLGSILDSVITISIILGIKIDISF